MPFCQGKGAGSGLGYTLGHDPHVMVSHCLPALALAVTRRQCFPTGAQPSFSDGWLSGAVTVPVDPIPDA